MSFVTATVTKISKLSQSVNAYILKVVESNNITFKPGQWVDMVVPGIDGVTGYSMTSSPVLLQRYGLLHLAVKYSDHPITSWMHTKCKQGSEVTVKIGGDFFYVTNSDPVLLIAGGVGINPLYSIINTIMDDLTKPVRLLYSASSAEEILFLPHLKQIQSEHPNVRCQFFTTQEKSPDDLLKFGRIGQEDIREAVSDLTVSNVQCYICGPPALIDNMEDCLTQLGFSSDHVFSERWWMQDDLTH